MRCTTCASDDHAQSTLFGGGGVLDHVARRAMGGNYTGFKTNAEIAANIRGRFQGGPIGIAAHDYSDNGFVFRFHVVDPKKILPAALCAASSARATSGPSAVTCPI